MKLTKDEAVRLSREHWKWLAETGSANKQLWLDDNGYEDINCDCFLCEYSYFRKAECGACPVVWKDTGILGLEPCMMSYFGQWRKAKTREERKRLAKIISELPEKEV